jgi:hypothetical protein
MSGVFRKSELEGYVLIDHTDSPGFTPDEAAKGARTSIYDFVGPGQKLEAATLTCSHCQRVVIMNPDRIRTRGWCSNCDHYICDWCNEERQTPGYVHKSYKEKMDQWLEDGLLLLARGQGRIIRG